MEDLTGLGKIADSQLVNKVYDDLVSGAAKETGELARDVAKAFRLFTLPLQLAATAQDRISIWLDQVRNRVPESRQVEAPPLVAGPVIRNLIFMENDNPLLQMYLELLTRSIDRERQDGAHPGFVSIIEQLSPEEALFFHSLANARIFATLLRKEPNIKLTYDSHTGNPSLERGYVKISNEFRFKRDEQEVGQESLRLAVICRRLISLSLVAWETRHSSVDGYDKGILVTHCDLVVTPFGKTFADACLPGEFDAAPKDWFETDRE